MQPTNANEAQSAGELDQSFGVSGLRKMQFSGANKTVGKGVAITPTGQIMVSATIEDAFGGQHYGLARLTVNGHSDLSFGNNGYLQGQYKDGLQSQGGKLNIDASGKIWVCGVIDGTTTRFEQIIACHQPDGSLYKGFGDNQSGYKTVPMRVPALYGAANGHMALAHSNPGDALEDRILFVTSQGGIGLLSRFNRDGTDDPTFASRGWFQITLPGVPIVLQGVMQLKSGLILVYGHTATTRQGLVMAFDNAGQVAKSFGNDGTLLLNLLSEGAVLESAINFIDVDSEQRLLLIGSAVESSAGEKLQHALMLRITDTGAIDTTFNGGKPTLTAPTDPRDLKSWTACFSLNQPVRIVSVGQTSEGEQGLLTGGFREDGAIDQSFDTGGAASIPWIPGDARLQDSRVLVMGTHNSSVYLTRLLTASVS